MIPNMQHFESLKEQINQHLKELVKSKRIAPQNARSQIEDYPWLYGALGKVPAEVMFICQNPSSEGIRKAHVDTIDGGPPDIEAQWWGGSSDKAARCFRVALYDLKLKTTRPNERGGWECYITNVIKQANIAKDQEALSRQEEQQQAIDWAGILQWELDQVKPKYVFCAGGKAFTDVQKLRNEGYLKLRVPIYKVTHYSARYTHAKIIDEIVSGVKKVISTDKT